MSNEVNRQWRVAEHPPPGSEISAANFTWTESAMPAPADGEFLVRTRFLAPGPAQRGYLDASQAQFLGKPIPIGEVMRGRGIGEVVASRHPEYKPGEIFVGSLGWQDYTVQKPIGKEFVFSTRKIANPRTPLSLHLGVLGQAGATAYFGLQEAAQVKAGDNVLISAAAGGVGSVAGQIARFKGASKVVGLTGSDYKCSWLREYVGYDYAINYKTEDLDQRLTDLFPQGIDVYLDSVGEPILNTVMDHLAMRARVAVGGFIASQYSTDAPTGPANYRNLVFKRARMQGFVFFDYWDRYAEAEQQLCEWYDAGLLVDTEYLTEGLENMPAALADLFSGGNQGIAICSV